MALDLNDEVSEEFLKEIRKIAKKYSSGFENELRGALSEQILKIRAFVESESLNEICTYVSVLPVFDFKHQLMNYMTRYLGAKKFDENIDDLENQLLELAYSIIFAYLTEYKLRKPNLEKMEAYELIENYLNVGRWKINNFKYAGDKISYSIYHLIFNIIEDRYKKSQLIQAEEKFQIIDNFISKVDEWNESFELKHKAVLDLEKQLEESKQTYDFVLLNKGFKELYEQKKLELKERREDYSQFGATLVCVPLAVIIAIIILILTGYEAKLASMWFLVIPITTLMLFLFYFTRVGLQHVRSVQSQMMQLELRMALCQFIHNYAEDSEKLHAKNKAGFEKFENIIFSPLVSSDDKIPTTFDGMEQLAKLVSEFRR
ncbi:hypothetical protein [Acinetobacter schindleri]|uniref:hypothetical protein n=1 Tax=Acinetobacter schindleri TaxID=108981 RepID=UPI0013B09977|nr:hypothetical protein [Acinetobacter schindleri]QIC64148.1 hypothetical protein FSC11_07145 [Acinetobacter schindleri]